MLLHRARESGYSHAYEGGGNRNWPRETFCAESVSVDWTHSEWTTATRLTNACVSRSKPIYPHRTCRRMVHLSLRPPNLQYATVQKRKSGTVQDSMIGALRSATPTVQFLRRNQGVQSAENGLRTRLRHYCRQIPWGVLQVLGASRFRVLSILDSLILWPLLRPPQRQVTTQPRTSLATRAINVRMTSPENQNPCRFRDRGRLLYSSRKRLMSDETEVILVVVTVPERENGHALHHGRQSREGFGFSL